MSHPRINCIVDGCKRGSTKFAPGTLIICGKCWQLVPKHLRNRRQKLRAALRHAERRQNLERYRRLWDLEAAAWEACMRSLTTSPLDNIMPGQLAAQLRREGLL